MRRTLLLGPPGCGKTTRLLADVSDRLTQGVPPERIAYVSFTRVAVREARDRASETFGLGSDVLPFFRTVHSLCFRELGLRRSDVFGRSSLRDLANLTGEAITGHFDPDKPTLGNNGDEYLFLDQYARSKCITLQDAWHEHGGFVDWLRLKRFTQAYTFFRSDLGQADFTDMLERYVTDPIFRDGVDVDAVFIDEAQDLTELQWRVIDRAFGHVTDVTVAGDDDQAIFRWAGADASRMMDWTGSSEVLSQSHRLPRAVFDLAADVLGLVQRRLTKPFRPTDRAGSVERITRPDEVDLSAGTWLLLARTRAQLQKFVAVARTQGVTYSLMDRHSVDTKHVELILAYERQRKSEPGTPIWHDALSEISLEDREYYLACLRRGENLLKAPRVRIETIHGAKGAEADNVVLLTDLNRRIVRGMELDPDAERRVWYVGVTRARERLYIVEPATRTPFYL